MAIKAIPEKGKQQCGICTSKIGNINNFESHQIKFLIF